MVSENEGGIVGFTSAYLLPDKPDTLFVWQVAVHQEARGLGLATGMLHWLLARDCCQAVRYLETTITPSNLSSQRLFERLAQRCGAPCERAVVFPQHLFGSDTHEEELLFRIGPINRPSFEPAHMNPKKEMSSL